MNNETEQGIITKLRIAGCVFAEDETRLLISEAPTVEELKRMVLLRVSGLPIEHIIGYTEFCGVRIELDRGVFVPRQRTVLLANQAIAQSCNGDIVVDLCCGSGAVGVAIASKLGRALLYSVDIDPIAVGCASRNIAPYSGYVFEGDLYDALPYSLKGRVNILVANAPYVPTNAITLLPQEARIHEARIALDGGVDGLGVVRRVAEGAAAWLAPGGHLLVETSDQQAPMTVEIFTNNGLNTKVVRDDELDATVVTGTKPD